jgi:hypothetical protein
VKYIEREFRLERAAGSLRYDSRAPRRAGVPI